MNSTSYKVKTKEFEGPLDLLLELVTKRKLFINDVSLAGVTDDFIEYIEKHDDFPIEESAEFIVVASTLMLVKSRSLLPMITLSEEEEESIHDLAERLEEYAKYKNLSQNIKDIFGKEIIYEKKPSKISEPLFSPDSKTNISNLSLVLEELIHTLPKEEKLTKTTVQKVASLEDTIDKLAQKMSGASRMSFKDFYSKGLGEGGEITREDKVSVIVGFLAMLELVKRGVLRVSQEAKGEIEMESEEMSV